MARQASLSLKIQCEGAFNATGVTAMKRVKAAVAAVVLAMWAGPASFAQVAYIPPGEQAPRFGGEFNLSEVGPVPGYWRTECYNWRVRSQSRRDGPLAASPVDAAIKRFV